MNNTEVFEAIRKRYTNKNYPPTKKVFDERYSQICAIDNIDKLFNRITKCTTAIELLDLLTEFNLLHQLCSIYSTKQIGYEREYELNNMKYYPDISVKFQDKNLYIQVKRMRKSADCDDNAPTSIIKNGKFCNFVPVYDEKQIRTALTKACKKCPVTNTDILLVAQEIHPHADVGKETISNALFGDEQYVYNNQLIYWKRNSNGFYNSEYGKLLYGYIQLECEDSRPIKNYNFDLFPNYQYAV